MRVEVDRSKCTGIGLCEMLVAEVFEVDDDGAVRVHNENLAAAEGAVVREAVGGCPTAALSISDDD